MISESDKKKLVVLIVDDDGQVRDILDGYLRSFGFENILQARDGKVALKIIQNSHQHLDMVISDWEMPHIDGLTLLKAIRRDSARESVKFIMVTSQGSRERMKITKAAKSHVDAYVVKPFRAQVLREKIDNLLNGVEDKSVAEFEELALLESASVKKKGGVVVIDNEARGLELEKYAEGLDLKGPIGSVSIKDVKIKLILKLSKSYFKIRWFDKGIKLCLEANTLFPGHLSILLTLARGYYLKNDLDSAGLYLKEVIKIDPYNVDAQTLVTEIEDKKAS